MWQRSQPTVDPSRRKPKLERGFAATDVFAGVTLGRARPRSGRAHAVWLVGGTQNRARIVLRLDYSETSSCNRDRPEIVSAQS